MRSSKSILRRSEINESVDKIEMGSDRGFAFVFATVFAVVASWPLLWLEAPRLWAIILALSLLAVGYLNPALVRPLNIAWFQLGLLLNAVVTPVVMALLYFVVFLPTSLILRMAGKDLLALKRAPDQPTYWVVREKSAPGQETMRHQF